MKTQIRKLTDLLLRMSPFQMLLIIGAAAGLVTALSPEGSDTNKTPSNPFRTIVFSKMPIPAGKVIAATDVVVCDYPRLHGWSDATTRRRDVVGHKAKHAIPQLAQIRQIDLE